MGNNAMAEEEQFDQDDVRASRSRQSDWTCNLTCCVSKQEGRSVVNI